MNKFRSLVIAIALVCCFMLINYAAARPDTTLAVPGHSLKTQLGMVEESCEGVGKDGDGCLIRRTLAAHVDYIYTQDHNP
ncbi:hypothetical protein AB3S75_012015 [Citrus x aurantiifolia]